MKIEIRLIDFINRFCDGKMHVAIFDSWYTDEETVHYEGRLEDLMLSPEKYDVLLNMYVEQLDVGKNKELIILVKVNKFWRYEN